MRKQRGGNTHEDILAEWTIAQDMIDEDRAAQGVIGIIVFGIIFCLMLDSAYRRGWLPKPEADRWTKKDRRRAFFFAFGLIALVGFGIICYEIWLRRTT